MVLISDCGGDIKVMSTSIYMWVELKFSNEDSKAAAYLITNLDISGYSHRLALS